MTQPIRCRNWKYGAVPVLVLATSITITRRAGYELTEFGEKVFLLMQHRFRSLLRELSGE